MDLSGVGVWSVHLRYGDQAEAADAAAELEDLGFAAVWIPDGGGPLFDSVGHLLAATRRIVVGTGVMNLWMHTPVETAASHASLSAAHGDRFLLGVGVGHAPAADAVEPGRPQRPLAAMRGFLDALDTAARPVPRTGRVLAALGPKMLQLAGERARGIHPYLVTPDHTQRARELLGEGPLVLPEQTVILCESAEEARAIGTDWLRGYLARPNYAGNLLRMGFAPEEVASVSDRLFDALIAWGDEEAIRRRVGEHYAAGANHVAVQVLTADPRAFPREQWRRLAAALK
ncbi:TIGR03620 family F420-dependent LLM class oxidoreductase [Frankia sp. CNm7]|uniref:TIGR03620 family F420-dependent LLM class oxidoreductase n=1 Tax=Frankia nepalensis TaxID=1836974 RepID=A0A937RRW5_9ACTN|nr:TIGR03620 family F420-dependent LLM class oxidoreductase [Frankia nepalensis]MBL7501501.1 TIGR03620 family F420-dependent LLM class oxidoreductase [Frankia nepalensis]MBL7513629.1 TIGR03620 family F420-dependent LLM class oxidoreductase [Frankia nepalensis]MBL7523850.1 TIGR03620 family F420-dependent LLM class oxidoreductase [Frankia nepalensis]MBL7633754.1 TIGR03620 family F420-dependent LLM class oxidoreductase [Frankia nepalensis]